MQTHPENDSPSRRTVAAQCAALFCRRLDQIRGIEAEALAAGDHDEAAKLAELRAEIERAIRRADAARGAGADFRSWLATLGRRVAWRIWPVANRVAQTNEGRL